MFEHDYLNLFKRNVRQNNQSDEKYI